MKIRALRVGVVLFAAIVGCEGGDGNEEPGTSAGVVTFESATVVAGQTTRVSVREDAGPDAGAPPVAVTWESSNPAIATVSPTGSVATLGAGVVTISASRAGARASGALTVTAPPSNVRFAVVELSPPVHAEAAPTDTAVIVDAPESATAASLTLAVPWLDPVAFRRIEGSQRLVALVPGAAMAALLAHAREQVSCIIGVVCSTGPTDDRFILGTLTIAAADGSVPAERLLAAPFVPADVPPVAVTMLASHVQRSSYVVNVHSDDLRQNGSTPAVTRELYRHLGDVYGFLALTETASAGFTPFYEPLRNRVSGTGVEVFDHSATYGASPDGELLGIVNFSNLGLDLGHQVTSHEIAHAFMNFLRFTVLRDAVPHWPLSTLATGVLGGAGLGSSRTLTPLGDGTHRVDFRHPYGGFNDLELYLLGLADPSEVEEQIVFDPQPSELDEILDGPLTRVSIDDVIAAHGARVPAWDGTPVTFRMATIVVSRGRLLTPLEMTYYDRMAARGEATTPFDGEYGQPFSVNTRGRGILKTRLD